MWSDLFFDGGWVVCLLLFVVLAACLLGMRMARLDRLRRMRTSILLEVQQSDVGLALAEVRDRFKDQPPERIEACWNWLIQNLYLEPAPRMPGCFRTTPLGAVRLTLHEAHKDFVSLSRVVAA